MQWYTLYLKYESTNDHTYYASILGYSADLPKLDLAKRNIPKHINPSSSDYNK